MTLPVCPQRARDSRAPHGPRMGPHGPSSAYPLACVKWHAPPCSGMRAPCEASGRLGRALPSAGSGLASAARRMGPHGPAHGPPHEQRIDRIDRIDRIAFTVELTEQIRQEKDSS